MARLYGGHVRRPSWPVGLRIGAMEGLGQTDFVREGRDTEKEFWQLKTFHAQSATARLVWPTWPLSNMAARYVSIAS
ncbi:hypothetical protein ACOMHN_062354 [Nucella lapillus]